MKEMTIPSIPLQFGVAINPMIRRHIGQLHVEIEEHPVDDVRRFRKRIRYIL